MKKYIFLTLFTSTMAFAGPGSMSFNGNLAGATSINSLVLAIYSGSCNLFQTPDYGATTMDASGNFTVTIGAVGNYFGNAYGATYSSLSEIFDTTNSNILGQGGCSVNGSTASWQISVAVNGIQLAGGIPINASAFAINAQNSVNSQKIGGVIVATTNPTTSQVLQYNGVSWAPATLAGGGSVTAVTATSPLVSTGTTAPVISLGGLTSFGTANQLLAMNATATGYEYKSMTAGTGINITQGAGSVTVAASGELAGLSGLNTVGYVKRTGTSTYATSTAFGLTTDVTGVLPVVNGGTNSSTALAGGRLMYSNLGTITEYPAIAVSSPMRTDALGLPTTGSISLNAEVAGVLPILNGGTGTTSGSITGNGALTFTAGPGNQNVSLVPTGTGIVNLGNKAGIGTASPASLLHVYQPANTKSEINIGVAGTGNAEVSNLNLMTFGGSGGSSLGVAGTKGYQLRASGNNNTSPNIFKLTFWDGTTPKDIFEIAQAYTALNTPAKISSYYSGAYTATSGTQALPESHELTISNNAGSGTAAVNIFTSNNQSAYLGVVGVAAGNSPLIVLGQQTGANAYSERMRFDASGKMGVATTTPIATLDVNGGVRGRTNYPSCATGCAALSLPLALANAFYLNVGSGSVTLGTANATAFSNFDGMEFSMTVCAPTTTIAVTFGGHASGFATGVTWPNVATGYCTSQKFVIMNTGGGYYAHPLSAYVTYLQ